MFGTLSAGNYIQKRILSRIERLLELVLHCVLTFVCETTTRVHFLQRWPTHRVPHTHCPHE